MMIVAAEDDETCFNSQKNAAVFSQQDSLKAKTNNT